MTKQHSKPIRLASIALYSMVERNIPRAQMEICATSIRTLPSGVARLGRP